MAIKEKIVKINCSSIVAHTLAMQLCMKGVCAFALLSDDPNDTITFELIDQWLASYDEIVSIPGLIKLRDIAPVHDLIFTASDRYILFKYGEDAIKFKLMIGEEFFTELSMIKASDVRSFSDTVFAYLSENGYD